MWKTALMAAALLALSATAGYGQEPKRDIGFIRIDQDIMLRRMILRAPRSKGTVLLLHGFPETIYAWTNLAPALARDYDVHAIDWPGYGQSSRPAPEAFSYAPRDYARILKDYIGKAGIERSRLTIYATDIGALPALIAALDDPGIARRIIVGDFAPFNRPQHMYESLQALKAQPSAAQVRAAMNKNRDEILANTFWRGLSRDAFAISPEYRDDLAGGWDHGGMTSADAFYHYYSHFTRDQDWFEANIARLKTPLTVIWGEKDIYIKKEMGAELAERSMAAFTLLPGIGHYPHLQAPQQAAEEIRASFR